MSRSTERLACLAACLLCASCVVAPGGSSGSTYGFGTAATPEELSCFFSPLPDGRGLPKGSGSVAGGQKIYQAQCASCHGAALQGGLGDRLIGGRGTLVNDDPTKAPVKTVESYWPYATTLFDYIKRAMPLMSPGSLSDDEVYAVSAYILSQAEIVPADAVLDQTSLAQVRMPNRDGFIADHRPEKFPSSSETPHAEKTLPATAK
ncbi:MAG: c-type cytochrome [Burkholderiaceae bacterium]